jgi:hypothetical protein
MYRCIAACFVLLPVVAAVSAQKPSSRTDTPKTNASVKLWVDTSPDDPCEHSTPASGGWTIRNNEGRDVLVTVHRTFTEGGATKEDDVRDTLGPRESRDLGCEISEQGHQTLTVVRATF